MTRIFTAVAAASLLSTVSLTGIAHADGMKTDAMKPDAMKMETMKKMACP